MPISEILNNAKRLKNSVALMSVEQKASALINIASSVEDDMDIILRANSADLKALRGTLSDITAKKLVVFEESVRSMTENFRILAKSAEWIGSVIEEFEGAENTIVKKVVAPVGVIGIICESPSVILNAAVLALKSGSVCIIKTGKDTYSSVRAVVAAVRKGLKKAGVSQNVITLLEDVSDDSSAQLLAAANYIDLLIAYGNIDFMKCCAEQAKVPLIKICEGVCHVYIDEDADTDKALKILESAKCNNPYENSAVEVCLVHKNIAKTFLPLLHDKLVAKRNSNPVKFRLDEKAFALLKGAENCSLASADDFDKVNNDYILTVGIVETLKDAVTHILKHSTGHSECIVTENEDNAKYFSRAVDCSAVFVNHSTCFTEGKGLKAERDIGISTNKLYAQGPIGLKELTTYKYIVSDS